MELRYLGNPQPTPARPTHAGFLGTPGDVTMRRFGGPKATLAEMARLVLSDKGERSMLVRQFTEWVCRQVQPKDYLGELLAVRNVFVQMSPWLPGTPLFRYMNDPRHLELVKSPERCIKEIMQHGSCILDCFPEDTLLLRDDYTLLPISEIRPGMRIWGYDKWTTVKAAVYKGLLSVDAFQLNNRSVVRLTGDHHLLVGVCNKHLELFQIDGSGDQCACRIEDRELKRITVSELRVGMTVLAPERIPLTGGPPPLMPPTVRRPYPKGFLRVQEISRGIEMAECWDIETEDHHVYLPEHDITVQNCDEYSSVAASMCLQLGRNTDLVALGFAPGSLSHVGVRAQEPKSGAWIWIDGVAGPREAEAVRKAKEIMVWSLD